MALTAAELEAVVGVDDSPFSRGLDSMLGKFEKWGGKTTALLAGAGAIGGGLFAAGMVGGMNLDEVKGRLQAELGLTESESERIGGVAGKLFANAYGDSLDEVGAAVASVVTSIKGMRNATDSELQAMTARAMDFANVFADGDVDKAAEVAGVAIRSGLAKNGVEAFDLLTAASQRVPKALRGDLLDATEEYSQFFASVGISGEEAFAMLAKGSEKGMYGLDKVGDSVKEFTIRATDMSAGTKAAYDALGLDSEKMTNRLLAGGDKAGDAFDTIVDGLLGMKNPSKQSAAALALFGTPLEDLGVKDIPKFLGQLDSTKASLGNFKGASDRAGKSLNDNARTNLTTFTRGLQMGLVTVIGGAVIPALNDMTGYLATGLGPELAALGGILLTAGGYLSDFAGWIDDNRTPILAIAGLIAAVYIPGLVAMGVASLINGAKAVAGWVMQQAAALGWAAVHSAVVVLTVAGWVLMGAQSMIQAARMAAAWFVALGPIGWAIAAVALVAALVIANWGKIKAVTAAVWGWVVGKVVGAWGAIKGGVTGAAKAVLGFLKAKWPTILAILTGPIGLAVLAIARNWDKIKAGASSVVGWIKGIPGKIGALAGRFGTAGRNLLQGFVNGMKNAAGVISGIAGNVWNTVRGMLNGAIGRINAALEFTINTPGPGGISINPPDIPQLATGGRAVGATLAVFGEGQEAETVLPDSMLRGLLEDVHESGRNRGRREGGRGVEAHFHGTQGASARDIVDELSHALRVGHYGGVFAGAGAA